VKKNTEECPEKKICPLVSKFHLGSWCLSEFHMNVHFVNGGTSFFSLNFLTVCPAHLVNEKHHRVHLNAVQRNKHTIEA